MLVCYEAATSTTTGSRMPSDLAPMMLGLSILYFLYSSHSEVPHGRITPMSGSQDTASVTGDLSRSRGSPAVTFGQVQKHAICL
jgi:hypothetical protein